MRKLLLIGLFTVLVSCSKDNDCQVITGLEARKTENNSYLYFITLDNGNPISTNKATVDFYKHAGAPDCFEGFK